MNYYWEEFTYIRPEERDLYLSLGFIFQGDFIRNDVVAPVSFDATVAELYKQIGASENGQIVGVIPRRFTVTNTFPAGRNTASGMAIIQQAANDQMNKVLDSYQTAIYDAVQKIHDELILTKEIP